MSDHTAHPHGTFCWPELATTNQKAAVEFYRALFEWEVEEQPLKPGEAYSMFRLRGRDVGAAYTMGPAERQGGAPPHWNSYVSVDDADEIARRAQDLGGQVLVAPFDVMSHGRMAVVQDPTGAVFEIWQPVAHAGVGVLNEPGALCWTELTTSDMNVAEGFYAELFGWTPKRSAPGAPMPYTEFSVGGGSSSIGMMGKPPGMPPYVPSFWMPYFQVASADDAAARAKTLGAQLIVEPRDIPDAGRFSVICDPQGATFAVFAPKVVGR